MEGKAGRRVQWLNSQTAVELRQLCPGQCRAVFLLGGGERPFQVLGRVVAGPSGLDGIAHDGADPLQYPSRRFGRPTFLHLAQGIQHHGGRQFGDRDQP
ncbi:hypothetical protein D3C86_1547240 [compost metagenome]